MIPGGGCPEMVMAKAVDELAGRTPGKRSLAMEAFAKSLRTIPTIISDNAGLDSAELVSQLRAAHATPGSKMGIDVLTVSVELNSRRKRHFSAEFQTGCKNHQWEFMRRIDKTTKKAWLRNAVHGGIWDSLQGAVGDMEQGGIFESYRVKQQILLSATEAAEMIMRVDDIVKCAPRQRQ